MTKATACIAAALVLAAAGGARAQGDAPDWRRVGDAPQVEVRHAALRLVVIAESRRDISVSVQHGPSRLPTLSVRREDDRIVVDGGLERPFAGQRIDCRGGVNRGAFGVSDARAVVVGGYGRIAYADLPVVTAHVPLDVRVAGDGAVYGDVGGSRSLAVANSGCGDWRAGPVHDRLQAAMSGSGDLHAADVGSAQVVVSGSSDIFLGRAATGVDVVLHGSGDVTAGRVDGPVQAAVSGSGDVRLKDGRVPDLAAHVSGSGDFEFGGEAGRVDAVATGSGDIHIAHATGPVTRVATGSSEVTVGR